MTGTRYKTKFRLTRRLPGSRRSGPDEYRQSSDCEASTAVFFCAGTGIRTGIERRSEKLANKFNANVSRLDIPQGLFWYHCAGCGDAYFVAPGRRCTALAPRMVRPYLCTDFDFGNAFC
jgi:hypothetical protein